jgi:hypothetical protein
MSSYYKDQLAKLKTKNVSVKFIDDAGNETNWMSLNSESSVAICDHLQAIPSDKYNGWTNRETWAVHLWLTSDEHFYNEVKNRSAAQIEDYLKDLFSLAERSSGGELMSMFEDIGSIWRVNWNEVAEALKD